MIDNDGRRLHFIEIFHRFEIFRLRSFRSRDDDRLRRGGNLVRDLDAACRRDRPRVSDDAHRVMVDLDLVEGGDNLVRGVEGGFRERKVP